MKPRALLIAALLLLEAAVVGEGIAVALGRQTYWPSWSSVQTASNGRLHEGAAPRTFAVGEHPALTVDIGYADLTIRAGDSSQIEVSASKSTDFGWFRAKAPLVAREDGDTVSITTESEQRFAMGDDRRVTVVVPADTRVTVERAGDIKAYGLQADTSLNSIGSGTVTVEDFDARSLRIAASDGKISLYRASATHLELRSESDAIEGAALTVRDGSIESGDGRVSLSFTDGTDAFVNASADDGAIHVAGYNATHLDNRTGDDDASSLEVRIGAGSGRLDVHAHSGDIRISRES